MTIVTGERPGVYSSYEASSIVSRGAGGKTVAIAAACASGEKGQVYTFTSAAAARVAIGSDTTYASAATLVELALRNGAPKVVLCAASVGGVASAEDYAAAFEILSQEDAGVIICDSDVLAVQQALRDSAVAASGARRERVAVMAMTGGVNELVTRAAALAHERAVLVGPAPADIDGVPMKPVLLAAAFAGLVAGSVDPSIPLSGAVMAGIQTVSGTLSDGDVDALVRGGVLPLEGVAGEVTVVRAVTTRTKTGGAADTTWKELSTVLIADDVLVTLRDALRAKFARAKNLASTREAVRTQTVVELEAKRAAGIIAGYGEVDAAQNEQDPTRCDVSFEFAVAHGMNQIVVGAHILV